jgi:hypothetical protein
VAKGFTGPEGKWLESGERPGNETIVFAFTGFSTRRRADVFESSLSQEESSRGTNSSLISITQTVC